MQAVPKLRGVQVLRGVSFLCILAFHCQLPGTTLLWGGIETLFLISGYFFCSRMIKLADGEIHVIPEILHRLKRSYPAYLTLLVCAAVLCFHEGKRATLFGLLIYIGFLLYGGYLSADGLIPYHNVLIGFTANTWTLDIELQMFLIALITFHLAPKSNGNVPCWDGGG